MSQALENQSLEVFATTGDIEAQERALSQLISARMISRIADDPQFARGMARLYERARNPANDPRSRLIAISDMVRVTQVAKSVQPLVRSEIESALVAPLPPLSALSDAAQRLNVARACSIASADWLPDYIATAIAEEDQGERARTELLTALLSKSSSIAQTLERLSEAFANIDVQTEVPGDSVARRLVRTLSAFRQVAVTVLIDAGADLGRALEILLRKAFQRNREPADRDLQIELTREVALTIHDLVRTQFSVATEAETFSALKLCRRFFPGTMWPNELKASFDLLVKDISEALLLLGRQDVPNQGLIDQLVLICSRKDRARAVGVSLAKRHPELPERITRWLIHGQLTSHEPSATLEESLLQMTDAALGMALLEVSRLRALHGNATAVLSALDVYDPSLAFDGKAFVEQAMTTAGAIEDVAKRRGIQLFGTAGQEIEYAPTLFDSVGPVSGLRVTIKRPAVVRVNRSSSTTDVVTKGIVA